MRELFESLFVHGKYETLPEKHTSAEESSLQREKRTSALERILKRMKNLQVRRNVY